MTAMDRVFLRNLSTFEELGIYSVASSFAAVAIIFQNIFSTIWAPTVYKWAAEGINLEKVDQATEYVLATVSFFFVLAGLLSWLVPYLLPKQYTGVQYLFVACIAYPLFYTISESTVIGLGITRNSGYAMLAAIIAASTNIAGNYLLVPLHGAVGAAASTAFAFWIFLLLRTAFAGLVWRRRSSAKIYFASFVCLMGSLNTLFAGETHQYAAIGVWFAIGFGFLFLYRRSIHTAQSELRSHFEIRRI